MKTSFTLFLLLLLVCSGITAQIPSIQKVHTTDLSKTHLPVSKMRSGNSTLRSTGTCDTLILDYASYDETISLANNRNWNGLGTATPTGFMNSFVDSNHVGSFTSIAGIFDTVVYTTTSNSVGYLPVSTSTITVDSVGLLFQLIGPLTNMLHDSIVFTIYTINNGIVSPTKTIVYGDTSMLSQFIPANPYIPYNVIPVGLQLTPGESFAIGVNYLNKVDTSYLAFFYGYSDSCGTPAVEIGQEVVSLPSAFPSSLGAVTDYSIVSGTNGNSGPFISSSADNLSYGYFGLEAAPNYLPPNCAYYNVQDLVMYPIISVCTPYSATISADNNVACANTMVALTGNVFGTNSQNITYNWSIATGTGELTGNGSSTNELIMGAGNTTVTLVANDGTGNVSSSIVILNCLAPLSVNLGNDQTACSGSQVVLNPSISGGQTPYSYTWQATGSPLSCNTCKNPRVTLTENSMYILFVTDASDSTVSDTINYTISGASTMQLSATNTNLDCRHPFDTTIVAVTNGIPPFKFNWGNSTSTGTSPGINFYYDGGFYIISVTDSQNCTSSILDTVLDNNIYITPARVVEPSCNGVSNGYIQVAVTGGVTPYSYNWNSGEKGDSAINAHYGTYDVSVTDNTGCSASFGYYLNPWSYYVYLEATEPNCSNNGSINVLVSGGTAPYSYLWSNNDTDQNIHNLSAGIYSLTVTDNAGCIKQGSTYLQANCVGMIEGTIFVDANNNCVYDNGETGVQDIYLVAYNNNEYYYGYTDYEGNYVISVNGTGPYTLSAGYYNYTNTCGSVSLCNNVSQTVSLSAPGDTSLNNNFGISTSTGYDLTIHPGWSSANPGFQKEYWVMPYNQSATPFTGTATVVFTYDSNLTYQSSTSPSPVNDPVAHTLTWQASNIPSPTYDWYNYRFQTFFQVPASLSLNYQLQSSFYITPTEGDCDSSNNYFHFSEPVTGSHDPNEKTVEPAGGISDNDSVLTYTIYFQNTGTDSTWFIVVRDSLTANLDPATVRNIASSLPYTKFTVTGKGILTWTFNPYRLADSITNPQTSKGFIKFTVKERANQPLGTVISNTASVFFDYNPPVVTNTVSDTLRSTNGISNLVADNGITVMAFPNPFNSTTNILVSGINEKYDFELYDVTGRLGRHIASLDTDHFILNRETLAAGIYFYRLTTISGKNANGKLVIQ